MTRAVVALLAATGSLALASAASAQSALVDDSVADFSAGVANDVVVAADGSVQLRLISDTRSEEFSNGLPGGWTDTPDRTSTGNGESLSVRGLLESPWISEPNDALEFSARFGATEGQYVGPSQAGASATFTTVAGGGLVARTVVGAAVIEQPLPEVSSTATHGYRIERRISSTIYFVDGAQVAVHPAIAGEVRVLANSPVTGVVTLDWMRFAYPYDGAGLYSSRTFDGGAGFQRWGALAAAVRQPAGTGVALATRTGATPAGPWSSWQAPGAGGDIVSPDQRYLQYQAELTATERVFTPALDRVAIGYVATAAPGGGPGGSAAGSGGANGQVAPRVRLRPTTVRVSRRRGLSLRVSCPSGEDTCRTTVRLRHRRSTLARKTVVVPGGKTRRISLELSRKGYRTLVRRRSMRVEVSAAARDGAGNAATTRTTITLLAPRR